MAKATVEVKIPDSVSVTVPLLTGVAVGYEASQLAAGQLPLNDSHRMHVDIMLGSLEASAFLKVRTALRSQQAKLKDGKPVFNNNDVLRWLFQQIAQNSV